MFMGYYSPLRYPGGKGRFSGFIQLLYECNCMEGGHYFEPYAGGASVAMSLLLNEYVSNIHINDYDYSVYCFWRSVIDYPDLLCRRISDSLVTISEWERQKKVQENRAEYDIIDVGFSTFFLNRTNRSGILKGGVIGGKGQNGDWRIDARYNKKDLIKRIQRIAVYKKRINLYNCDAVDLMPKIAAIMPKNSLIYLDPPYYNKGKALYVNFYDHRDHEVICKEICKVDNVRWIVSYDDVEQIRILYKSYRQKTFYVRYHAGNTAGGSEVFVFSDNLMVPKIDNPTDKESIRKYAKKNLFDMRMSVV